MDILHIGAYSFYRSIYPPVESNMYIFINGDEAIVVDSNINDAVRQIFDERRIEKVHLFLTHEHYDHAHGVCWFKENYNTVLYCHKNCKDGITTRNNSNPQLVGFVLASKDKIDGGCRYADFKSTLTLYDLMPDVLLDDEQVLDIVGHRIKIMHAPGHTPGSCILIMDDNIAFSGDSLILGNKIITGFRGGNRDDMLNVTLPRLKQLPDDMTIMPGHGDPFKKKDFNFNIYNNV